MAGSIQYTYDSLNRLTKVEREDGTAVEYTYDAAGNRLTKTVTVTNTAPNVPSSPSPADGATGVNCSTGLSWASGDPDADDMVTYDVYLDKVMPLSVPVSQNQSATSFSPSSPLERGTDYCWKVVAKDQHGATREGPVWHFTTATNTPPNMPSNPSPADGATGVSTNTTLSWTGGDPDAGDVVTYDGYLYNDSPMSGLIIENLSATSFNPGSFLEQGTDYYWKMVAHDQHGASQEGPVWHFTTAAAQSADLSITMKDSADPAKFSSNLTYTLTVSNAGPGEATSVSVVDTLPAAATFVKATATQGECTHSSPTVQCNLGTVQAGAAPKITIVVKPNAIGTITNLADVSANETDPNPANNHASQQTTLKYVADLTISASDVPDPAKVGAKLTYTLTISNAGPKTGTNVVVTDTLPAGVTFVSKQTSQGSCTRSGRTVTCNLGNLSKGATAKVILVVKPTTPGTITNAAKVSRYEIDPNAGNNKVTLQTVVQLASSSAAD